MEFNTGYKSPLDREYHTTPVTADKTDLSEPIIPIKDLGITVPESDPQSGANILHNVQAAIRAGTGTMQIVMTTPHTSALGGRPKAYGKEVREAIRETARANDVTITGIEMPTAMNSMAGLDPQRGTFSEEVRENNLQEVKDSIKFVADIAGGGGIDMVSQEFPRTIFDAKWNQEVEGKPMFTSHEQEEKYAVKHLIDKRTGQIIESARLSDKSYYPVWRKSKESYTDNEGKEVKKGDYIDLVGNKVEELKDRVPEFNKEKEEFELVAKTVNDFEDEAKEWNRVFREKHGRDPNEYERKTPEEMFFESKLRTKQAQDRAWVQSHAPRIKHYQKERERLLEQKELYEKAEKDANDEQLAKLRQTMKEQVGASVPFDKNPSEILDKLIKSKEKEIEAEKNYSYGHQAEMQNVEIQLDNVTTIEKYAKKKVFDSYAEAGIAAMEETNSRTDLQKDIHVGPELGWPTSYGGHPDEFIEIIEKSREEMVRKLEKQGYDRMKAQKAAETHIQGVFDTSHLGMWLNNFRKKPGESEADRKKAFDKWYMEQVEKIAKKNVTAGIQAVDSASGAHGHLPPGQGIFPVVEAVQAFKKHGYNGWVVSEGHEEEKFGKNRILLQTWEAFGSPLARMGMHAPTQWGNIRQAYFGKTYTPNFIVGAYSPSNEFKLWTEVPLE